MRFATSNQLYENKAKSVMTTGELYTPDLFYLLLLLGSHQVEWKNSAEEQKSGRARGIVYVAFCRQARQQQVKTNIFCRKIQHAFSIR
jgi:hypothetical protein